MAWAGVSYGPGLTMGTNWPGAIPWSCVFCQGGGGARRRVLANLSDLKENS